MVSSVTIRLGTTGKADVLADFASMGDSGEANAKRLSAAYDRAGNDIAAATKRQADAAAKISAIMPSSTQATVNASVGTGYSGAQNANAAQYAALLAQQERQVEAVRSSIDPLYASQKRYDAELATSSQLLKAGAISEAEYAKAVGLATAALEQAKQVQADRASPVRDTGSDANAHVAAYAASLALQQRQVDAVRAAIDPLYTAQKRYDSEIATSSALLRAGAISETEHAAAVTLSERALQEAKDAVDGHTGALGLNRQQIIIAQSAVLRFTDAVIAGRNPLTAFALEAHKGVEVLSSDEGGLAGGLQKVAALVNPVSVGVAALTAVVAIGALEWVHYYDAMAKLDTLAAGAGAAIGVTGQQLEANAQAVNRNGVLTVAAARDIETGYVRMGGIGADVLGRLTGLTADFAAATGTDAKTAQDFLGKAFQDPIAGAEELAAKYGFLTQAQVDEIRQTEAQNGLYVAQVKLIDDLGPAFDGAAKHAEGFAGKFDEIKASISGAWEKLGQFLAGASSAVPLAKQLADLQTKRVQADSEPVSNSYRENLDNQIADLKRQLADQQKANTNAASKFAQDGLAAGSVYTGYDQKRALEQQRDQIADGLRHGGGQYSSSELQEQRSALDAVTRALQTYLPEAEKKQLLDRDAAALAQARTPAAREAAGRQQALDQARGVVETNAQAQEDAANKGEQARARLDKAADKHGDTLARESAAIDANTRAAMDAARAYLTGGAPAGEEAEARRKAVTDATKKGTDVGAATRQQIAASGADADLAGAKAISNLLQESAARRQVNADVESGVSSVDDMTRALGDEQALRALTTAQTLAQKNGLTDLYRDITAEIEKYKQALDEAHTAEADSDFLKTIDAVEEKIRAAQLVAKYAGDSSGDLQRAQAVAASNKHADESHYTPEQRATSNVEAVLGTNVDLDSKRATSAAEQIRASNDNLAITQAQIAMVGKSSDAQELVLNQLKLQQKEAHDLGDEYDKFAPAILASAAAADQSAEHLKQVQAGMAEIRQIGDKFIDDVFNPKGNGLKKALADVRQELEQIALINPLKNFLLGENNPTIMSLASGARGTAGGGGGGISGLVSSLVGKVKGLFGIGGGGGSPIAGLSDFNAPMAMPNYDFTSSIMHFAAGTEDAPGGVAEVGENGPERIYLPQGSRVTNAADTRRMMSAANDPAHIKVSIESNDAMFNARISSISGAHVQAAAPGIRSAAVSDVKEHYARLDRYTYGRGR